MSAPNSSGTDRDWAVALALAAEPNVAAFSALSLDIVAPTCEIVYDGSIEQELMPSSPAVQLRLGNDSPNPSVLSSSASLVDMLSRSSSALSIDITYDDDVRAPSIFSIEPPPTHLLFC